MLSVRANDSPILLGVQVSAWRGNRLTRVQAACALTRATGVLISPVQLARVENGTLTSKSRVVRALLAYFDLPPSERPAVEPA